MDRNENIKRPDDLNKSSPIAPGQPPPPPVVADLSRVEAEEPEEPQTIGQWWCANGSTLGTMAAVLLILYLLNENVLHIGMTAAIYVAVGLGFIIFIHELGHFLVAKWCDVHVTTFSIGFGPALPFCSAKWGETTYKLAVLPLGGYVQMVGQVDGDEGADAGDDDPRSYKNKSVWQRMAIISAGVIMNAIFACVAFTAVFLGPGKPRQAAIIAAVDTGKPAFKQGLRSGDEITDVNGITQPYFEDLKFETIATLGRIEITTRRYGVEKTYDITPHQGSVRQIGISPTVKLQLKPRKALPAPDFLSPVHSGSPAAEAKQFEFEDVIVGVTNPEFPGDRLKMMLPPDPRNPNSGMKDFFEFQRRMSLLAGKDITIIVERGTEGAKRQIEIPVKPAYHHTLGARMKMGQIVALRDGSAAQKAGVLTPRPMQPGLSEADDKAQKLEGDVIDKVVVVEPDGKETVFLQGKDLDPVRLPYQLKQWAERMWTARGNNPSPAERKVKLYLKRQNADNAGPVLMKDLVLVELEWDHDWRNDLVLAMAPASPQAIPELGLAYQVKNQVESIEPGVPNAKLEPGDEIIDIAFVGRKADGTSIEGNWTGGKAIKGVEWAYLFQIMQASELDKVKVKVKRAGKDQEFELEPLTDTAWPRDERGLIFDQDSRVERADNALQAIGMGFRDTYRSIVQVFLSLRGLGAGTISLDNLGGPVAITTTAYKVAQYDFWEFVFFLGLISVNLAVLNFLPIPVLDGGHMVFLLYEKLRGKPASEGVRIGATYAGLLVLGCLMIFVLFLDIRRLVGG